MTVPDEVPDRGELWRRVQLARSVLAHRDYTRTTAELVVQILTGTDKHSGWSQ